MTRKFALVAVFALSAVAIGFFIAPRVLAEREAEAKRVPVLVELFTSQGCSSCPPADKVLRTLSDQPIDGVEIIPLSWHVDYWNRLGWTDPFSSETATARQQTYARRLNSRGLYTPQMVVDGQVEFVGSDRSRAYDAIRKAAAQEKSPLNVSVRRTSGNFTVRAENQVDGDSTYWSVMLVLAEDGIETDVKRGENGGKMLQHTAVVRDSVQLKTLGSGVWEGSLSHPGAIENLAVVVMAQDSRGRIVAIGRTALAD